MIKKFNRGFTLIELLVVIAIIGILSSVVLASLNTARAKGADAAIKSNLNNMRAQAELFYDNAGNTYNGTNTVTGKVGVCNDDNVVKALAAAAAAGSVTSQRCNNGASSWSASSQMKSDTTTYWC